MEKSIYYDRHRDDEFYDEIGIRVVERYKTSGLSGDEWRFSHVLELKRKGELIFSKSFHTIEMAIKALPWFFSVAGELGMTGNLCGATYDEKAFDRTLNKCAQPGCCNVATSEYRLKKKYSREGYSEDATTSYAEHRIKFCQKHLRRGDYGLQDADDNYEVVEGDGADRADMTDANITESAQVMVNVKSIDEIGEAVAQVMKDKSWEPDRQ